MSERLCGNGPQYSKNIGMTECALPTPLRTTKLKIFPSKKNKFEQRLLC